jgi:hypothetical protein
MKCTILEHSDGNPVLGLLLSEFSKHYKNEGESLMQFVHVGHCGITTDTLCLLFVSSSLDVQQSKN